MIELKPFTEEDFDTLISWIDSEETLVQFAGINFTYPLTREQLALNLKNPKLEAYKAIHTPTANIIGHGEIYFNDANEAVLGKIIIGDVTYRGKGFGQQIVDSLLEISFEKPGVNKAMLYVFDWNIAAIKCYEKVGFVIEKGVTKRREANGKIWTAIKMSINKKTELTLTKTIN